MVQTIPVGSSARRAALLLRLRVALAAAFGLQRLRLGRLHG